jgi:hypothetical protein
VIAADPSQAPLARIAIDPEAVERDLGRLVLTLVEFVRRLLEAQALRRFEAETLTDAETERLGAALEASRAAVLAIAGRLDIDPATLTLDLGPLGRLV